MGFVCALEYLYEKGIITYLDYRNAEEYEELDDMVSDYCGYDSFEEYLRATDPETYAEWY